MYVYIYIYIYILGVARFMYVHVTRSLQQFANTNRCIQILGVRQAALSVAHKIRCRCHLHFNAFFFFFLAYPVK